MGDLTSQLGNGLAPFAYDYKEGIGTPGRKFGPMAQDMAAQLLYSNSALAPEKPMGFAPRFASLSTGTSQTANNIVNGAGATAW